MGSIVEDANKRADEIKAKLEKEKQEAELKKAQQEAEQAKKQNNDSAWA